MASKQQNNWMFPGKMRILASGILLFSMGILCGVLAGGVLPHQQMTETTEDENTLAPEHNTSQTAATVRDTTLVEWITFFSACGHECVLSDRESAVGMTADMLAETYKGYEVRLFTDAHVKLKRELQGWCPEHFVLLMEDGALCVKKTDAETMLPYKVATLSASSDIFTENELKTLETGMAFDSLAAIDMYFEGIDS